MIRYKKKLSEIYPIIENAGKIIWKGLSFSLADPMFSFAKVVCISIEAGGVYLVYGEKALWRINIRQYKYYPLPENQTLSPEYVASAASSFINEFKISKASFVLCLPRSWAIIQNVDFPLAAKEDLSKVISFELDRLTPLTKDNAYYDYSVLGENAQAIKILLAVVRADQIDAYLAKLQLKNIQVKKISLSTLMLKNLIKNTYPNTNLIYISLKESAYESGVIVNSFPVRSYSGIVDANDESAIDGIIRQAYTLIEDLTGNSSPPRIVIDAAEKHYGVLREKLKTLTVLNLDKDIKLNVPKRNKEVSAISLGGALDSLCKDSDNINLLAKNNHLKTRTPWLITVMLLIALAVVTAFYFLAPVHFAQQKLDEMDRHIQMLKPDVKKIEILKNEVEAIEKDIKAINYFKKQSDLTMNVIKDMTTILPPKTWLTHLKITDTVVEIEGYSTSATEIILKLENSKYFQKVEYASPTFRDPRLGTERFVIKMELRNEKNKKDQNSEMKNEKKK